MAKPKGWWTTHPTILTVTVAGCWDSNGDGIGDFEGIRRHLDDLVGMGITGLRFQQVTRFDDDFEWYGLVAQDWFDADPVYGTMADFDRLMADCRARDFTTMVMAVPEYLGWRHPDYVAARDARAAGGFNAGTGVRRTGLSGCSPWPIGRHEKKLSHCLKPLRTSADIEQ